MDREKPNMHRANLIALSVETNCKIVADLLHNKELDSLLSMGYCIKDNYNVEIRKRLAQLRKDSLLLDRILRGEVNYDE